MICLPEIKKVTEFLLHSNLIENERGIVAMADAFDTWTWAFDIGLAINLTTILALHNRLLRRLRPDIAGSLRNVSVMVGGTICPPPTDVPRLMDQWLRWHANAATPYSIKQAHIAFEKMHPFQDGNGRIGRIIMNIQRVKAGLPLKIIHEGKEQREYYNWFV